MSIYEEPSSFHYSAAGTNTPTQVANSPVTLFRVNVANLGGSTGFLQIYNNGSADLGAGTPDLTIPVPPNVSTTSGTVQTKDRDYGSYGLKLSGGLSYLWANAATGTVVMATNAVVDIAYKGTA